MTSSLDHVHITSFNACLTLYSIMLDWTFTLCTLFKVKIHSIIENINSDCFENVLLSNQV